MFIDPHVHLRDFGQIQATGESIPHGLRIARDNGLSAVLDMPNTDPPVETLDVAHRRLRRAQRADVPEVRYYTYMGLTANPDQVQRAAEAAMTHEGIAGLKLYAGHSTGDLGVVEFGDQHLVFETLASAGYDGVLVVHCEKEEEMDNSRFDHRRPHTHCLARPKKAEIASIGDIIGLAETTRFPGRLHIAHISTPEGVRLLQEYRSLGGDVSCGVCPHHIYFNEQDMRTHGAALKMNPPLRSPGDEEAMLVLLREGAIDMLETDHAPHTRANKLSDSPPSGVTGLENWPVFRAYLQLRGFTDRLIHEVTFEAARERFGLDVEPRQPQPFIDRTDEYAFNVYAPMREEVGW